MNRVLLSLVVVAIAIVPACASSGNGVLVEERVVRLPNDQAKWYISVVGDSGDEAYQRVLDWFDENDSLKGLKVQVHFCPVSTDSAIYQERYASNVKQVPMVRVQKSQGEVVYEAAGRDLPLSPEGLYAAIADKVLMAQGIRPVLPWRREMDRRCPGPGPCPVPGPSPEPVPPPKPDLDPAPNPLTDGSDLQVVPRFEMNWFLALACILGFAGGLVSGYSRLYVKQRFTAT